MHRVLISIIGLIWIAGNLGAQESPSFTWVPPGTNRVDDLNEFLRPYLAELKLPSLAAAVVWKTNIIAAGAVGARKFGEDAPVTLHDRYHIGSCTKSMTALLAVTLDREGKIKLEETVGDVLGDWKLEGEITNVTLKMLLRNRSGLGNKPPRQLWRRAFSELEGTPPAQRETFLKEFLRRKGLDAQPNTKFIYSNFGFALAGAMLEERAGKPWENLVQEKIFAPLGMSSAGFGAPASEGHIDQPWGHQETKGKLKAIEPSDNPVAIAPAGAVHCSILDLARYAAFHLQAAQGSVKELAPYRQFLYSPVGGTNYAAGWIVEAREWAGGKIITHSGSNTMFYSVIWLVPVKGYAMVVSTNLGDRGDETWTKGDRIISALIKKFITK